MFFSLPYTVFGKIYTRYIKSFACQLYRMPALAAGHIQHFTVLPWFQMIYQLVKKRSRLRLITLKIKLVIIRRIEPVFKPGSCHFPKIQFSTIDQAMVARSIVIVNYLFT